MTGDEIIKAIQFIVTAEKVYKALPSIDFQVTVKVQSDKILYDLSGIFGRDKLEDNLQQFVQLLALDKKEHLTKNNVNIDTIFDFQEED